MICANVCNNSLTLIRAVGTDTFDNVIGRHRMESDREMHDRHLVLFQTIGSATLRAVEVGVQVGVAVRGGPGTKLIFGRSRAVIDYMDEVMGGEKCQCTCD